MNNVERSSITRLSAADTTAAVHERRTTVVETVTAHLERSAALQGESAIDVNRQIMGATNPADAEPGTIRADFADSIEQNVVHGSDGPETAAQEIKYFFGDGDICPRTR